MSAFRVFEAMILAQWVVVSTGRSERRPDADPCIVDVYAMQARCQAAYYDFDANQATNIRVKVAIPTTLPFASFITAVALCLADSRALTVVANISTAEIIISNTNPAFISFISLFPLKNDKFYVKLPVKTWLDGN